jgi:MFS family permease
LVQVTYVQMPKKLVGYGLSLTVLQTGYILCAIAAGVIAGGFLTGPAVGRFGPRAVIAAGAILAAASFFFQAYNHDQAWQFVVGNAAWGLGFAFAYAGAGAAYLLEATPGEAAMYSSANTVISLGIGGLGAGIFAAVLTSAATIPHTPIPAPAIFGRMYLYAGAVCLVMLGLGLIVRKPRFVPADSAAAPAAASASAPLV